jgi:hypothetical protein
MNNETISKVIEKICKEIEGIVNGDDKLTTSIETKSQTIFNLSESVKSLAEAHAKISILKY